MNTITTEQSLNNQSFFKLPLIFIATFFILYIVGMKAIEFIEYGLSFDSFPTNLFFTVFYSLPKLFLFSVTVIFCCQKYRLHSVIDSCQKVILIAIAFSLLYPGLIYLLNANYTFLYQIMDIYPKMDKFDVMFSIVIFDFILRAVSVILSIFIIILLFYLFAKTDVTQRSIFKLEGIAGERVYSYLYSFMMLFLSITLFLPGITILLISMSIHLDMGANAILSLTVLIFLFLSYITVYFATRNCFKRIEPVVKFSRLILTVLITYLFIFISSFVIFGILLIFTWQSVIAAYYIDENAIQTLGLTIFSIVGVINLLQFSVFSRLSVKIMYG